MNRAFARLALPCVLLAFFAPVIGAPGPAYDAVRRMITAGDYAGAEGRARDLLREAEAAHGAGSSAVADALDLLVESLWRGGRAADPESRRLAERAVAIREQQSGPDGLEVAGALEGLSNVLAEAGDLTAARSLCERALRIREAVLGPEHPKVGASVHNLATVMARMGDYAASRPLFERALAVRERALGPEHPDVGATLRNLGNVARITGDYPLARMYYERSLAIMEKTEGPGSLGAAAAVSNLAILIGTMGDVAAAEAAHRRALGIWEKVLPAGHPQIAYGLDNLAALLLANGDAARARPYFERALPILESALGPEHAEVALNLHSQALVRGMTGDRPGGRRLFERAVAIQEKALGSRHPDLADTLSDFGLLLKDMGDYRAARVNDERALAIRETTLGPGHPATAGALDTLARLLWLQGRSAEAVQKGLLAEKRAREQFTRCARELSQREALRYEEVRVSGLDTVLTALQSLSDPAARRKAAWAAWNEEVRARAMVLDEMAARHRTLAEQDDPAVRPSVEALDAARGTLARLLLRGPDPDHPEAFAPEVQAAEARQDRAERALAGVSAGFRIERGRRQAGLSEVLAALPRDGALVAYVHYGRIVEKEGKSPVPSYLAFVARSGRSNIAVVSLGSAQEIDALVRAWHDEISVDPRGQRAGAPPGEGGRSPALGKGARLRAVLWEPVAQHFAGARTVLVVPDGAIGLMNLATLPGPDGRYLLESGPTLHYLSAERDLVRPPARRPAEGIILALGGADYDAPIKRPSPLAQAGPVYRGAPVTCRAFHSLRFDPLPGALAEAADIRAIWTGHEAQVVLLTGAGADEGTFKRVAPGSRILHLATHGYFLGDECAAGGDDPLVMAGLALAGANQHDTTPDPQEREDGVLTGEEIAALDLSTVEWAVLSACETGLGRVQAGEGILGLRRAFEIAGARTLIMSLWKVEDETTRLFMRELYSARVTGLSTAESIRNAGLEILARQRREGLPDHPYFWGAFVAAGEWR